MGEVKPNSFAYRDAKEQEENEQENTESRKITTGKASLKKRTRGQKFADTFLAEDKDTVKDYILHDVVIPGAKDLLATMLETAMNMFLFGGDSRRRYSGGSRVYGSTGRTNYSTTSTINNSRPAVRANYRDRADYDNIVFESRSDAQEILAKLLENIDRYGRVSVFDLYDFCGLNCDYTLKRWGWCDLDMASVGRTNSGDYMIKLSKIQPLD
jgi:hypothetical protein